MRPPRPRPVTAGVLAILALAAGVRAGGPPASAPEVRTPRDYGYDPRPDLEAREPRYRERKRALQAEWDRLKADLIGQQRRGRPTHCSRQVLAEAKWLIFSTTDFDRAERRLRDLRARLDAAAEPHDGRQLAEDGSFGCCTEEWFLKLDNTVEELITLGLRFRRPEHPARLLERINDPNKLRAYLDSVRIADVRATGIDTRTELNHGTSALTRFILWSGTFWEIPTRFRLDPALKPALLDYLDETWQDPDTGYWGTWYRAEGGGLVKTADLSITFHIVSFREGRVKRWPRIVETTLALKGREYPYGWLEDGQMSNHHNYDVARLLHLGWPHMTEGQREQTRVEIARMLDWCLAETIEPDGSFKIGDESTLGGAFYFGVSFLDEVGYFSKANRFWTDREFRGSRELRDRILGRLRALKLTDPEATWARLTLQLAG